jgi:small neutral amino acid transporter SnatA (MarC family)
MSLLAIISSLISVLNPIGAVPMFISFTANRTSEEIKKIAKLTKGNKYLIVLKRILAV